VKLKAFTLIAGGPVAGYRHWCPGCGMNHVIYTVATAQPNGHFWRFNGNMEAPTFEPSINIVGQCHYFVRGGRIEYCSDSRHALAGQTLELPDLARVGEDWD
jgi:pyruvate/2-oxoacid:ferredoxin oxidoreductase beta subunit